MPTEPATLPSALIPRRVVQPVLVLGGVLLGVGLVHENGTWFATAGGVCLFLGGWGLRMPRALQQHPLVSVALVPGLMFAANFLEGPAVQLLPGAWPNLAMGLAGVLKLLCGLVAPPPALPQAPARSRPPRVECGP